MVQLRKWVSVFACVLTLMLGAGDTVRCIGRPGLCAASNVTLPHQSRAGCCMEASRSYCFHRSSADRVGEVPCGYGLHCTEIPLVMIARSRVTDPRAVSPARNAHRTDDGLDSHGSARTRGATSLDFFPFHPQLSLLRITVLII